MEAEFNHSNKEIFGFRMLESARKYGFIPEEVYSSAAKLKMMGHWPRCYSKMS